ncbi:MAG TPA: hypothetical protein VHM31_08825 [Polyangia bacterium]|nr:hypothetical protein [Polyangia bacterium]
MRTMMKISLPVEAGNKAIGDGTLGRVMQETMERIKPEAAYFTVEDGKRTAFMFFDLSEPSQLPVVGEPLFGMGADVQFTPAMSPQDLQKGLASLPRR